MTNDFNSEISRAAKVIETFRAHTNFGIPSNIVREAKGIAVLHVVKAGMLFSARSGNGILVARLPDGSWSAPSAIHSSGMGMGHQLGIEISDFVFVLNTDAAVAAFSKGHNFSIGGNMSISVGPLGRSGEVGATVKSCSAIFTYSHSKGLFAGASVELTCINERPSVNASVYGAGVTVDQILTGIVAKPAAAAELYSALGLSEISEKEAVSVPAV
ncbi:UNVERIFIED_CONTAM: SH3 domain-containing YSC84-like protein 1 [Siphonaria sp. JEL0065]|nr:SH3 domain-containing YSC84-like protein 1 [Siphonaria sp. JEL0065]